MGLPWPRWTLLALLLLLEILILTVRFDLVTLSAEAAPRWQEFLRQIPLLARLGVCLATAILLFAGARLAGELRTLSDQIEGRGKYWPFVIFHLLAFTVFAFFTGVLLEGHLDFRAAGTIGYALLWLGSGVATVLLLVRAALPADVCVLLLRRSAYALLLALAAGGVAWTLSLLTYQLWLPLGWLTLESVRTILALFCQELVHVPEEALIGTPEFYVEISPECSGYEGTGLLWGFLAFYLWYFRNQLRFPQVLVLFPVGTLLMWLTNILRITALLAIGILGWPDVALGGFHSQAGWLAFNAVALGMIMVSTRLPWFQRAAAPADLVAPDRPAPTAVYLGPLLALIAAMLVGRALSVTWDWLYPLRLIAVFAVVWLYRREYAAWNWRASWQAVAIGVLAFVVWLPLEFYLRPAESGAELARGLAGAPPALAVLWIAIRTLGAVLVVPFAEELAFRGYLTRRMIATDVDTVPPGQFSWLGFLVSSLLFGILHSSWLAGTLVGMLYGWAWYRRGSIGDAVVAHATTNALLAVVVIGGGQWQLWN